MIFSKRSTWPGEQNKLITCLEALRANTRVIDLTESNPTRCNFKSLNERLVKDLGQARNLVYDPQPQGLLSARVAISVWYARHGYQVKPEDIILTSSTSEAYSYLFRLIADTHETVCAPRPGYPLFESLAKLSEVDLSYYPLEYRAGWELSLAECPLNTKALILVNPHNPTGHSPSQEERRQLTRFCAQRKLALISDEVFWLFADAPPAHPIPSFVNHRESLCFTLNGLSKMMGMPQMKLAWIVVSGPATLKRSACTRLEMIADTYLSVNAPAQLNLEFWLNHQGQVTQEIKERIQVNRSHLKSALRGTALELLETSGWYAILNLKVPDDEQFAMRLLEQHKVFVYPGYFFGLEQKSSIVISLIGETEVWREGLKAILSQHTSDSNT